MFDSDIDPALGVVHAREWHFGALLFRKRVCHRVRRVDPTVRVEYIFRNVSAAAPRHGLIIKSASHFRNNQQINKTHLV